MRRFLILSIFVLAAIAHGCATTKSVFSTTAQLDTIEAYEAFVKKYPDSEYYNQAKARMNFFFRMLRDTSILDAKAREIATKYGIDFSNVSVITGAGLGMRYIEERNAIHYDFSAEWSPQLELSNSGTMPRLEYRYGGLEVNLPGLSVQYMDGTECRTGPETYLFINKQWYLKPVH